METKNYETVNGKNMAYFTGSLDLKDENNPVTWRWVAFATKIEANGAIGYWMVIDPTEGASLSDKIGETAHLMAKTFREMER